MRILVTGGGGFLGGGIVKKLKEEGHQVVSFSRNKYFHLEKMGVEQYKGDLSDKQAVLKASENCQIIYHVAAKAGIWGCYQDYYQPNVVGTQNILQACQHHQIPKLIYTSTPSVVHSGFPIEGANESLPYATHYDTPYPKTKAMAEKMVLKANSPNLSTVALRPHLIWGPKDNHLVPRILRKGRTGQLRKIGSSTFLVDSVYIDNAVEAHILAEKHLFPESSNAGKAYFITNGEPFPVWDLIDLILNTGGLPPVKKKISPSVAYGIGYFLEKIYHFFQIQDEPPMTRFMAKQLSTAHWFDISAAKRDFGYVPIVSMEEGMERLKKEFS